MCYPHKTDRMLPGTYWSARLSVDNLSVRMDILLPNELYTFLFSAFCTNHMIPGVSFSSVIGCRATISSPCINIWYCSSVFWNWKHLRHSAYPSASMMWQIISGDVPGNISAEIPFVFEMRITGDIPAEISDAVFFDAAVSGVSRAGSSTKAGPPASGIWSRHALRTRRRR